ncbi:MAG: co-chaperone GroES [Patescibacteria group bacterium]
MMFQPLGDRVLVKPLPAEEVRSSGIVIPDTAKEKPSEGKVVALGDGNVGKEKKHLFSVKVGDKVLYDSWAKEIKVDSQEYRIMKEEDILGILK